MIALPPIPSWDALHPLVVHFPVALLLVAPVLVLLGLVLEPKRGRGLLVAALVLMILGTVAAWVAVQTGEAAGRLADRTPTINAILEQHEELAETVRLVFTALTAVFAAVLFVPTLVRRPLGRAATTSLLVVYLGFYAVGALLLANTAHNGGRLVHEQGVHALMAPSPPLQQTAWLGGEGAEDEDD